MNAPEKKRREGPEGWEKFPLFWIVLFLSYRCTKRCPYCYAFNQVGGNPLQEMDDRVFNRLIEWIPKVWRASNVQVSVINFLGGEPLLRTDRIRQIMTVAREKTSGMRGLVNTNADLVDDVNWDDLEHIGWIAVNITDLSIDELARRMGVIAQRSNATNQTIAVTLDDHNLDRITDIARFGIESGYRLRINKNLFKGLDADYNRRVLHQYHRLCDLLEAYAADGYDIHTTFLIDLLIPDWPYDASPYPCGQRLAAVFPDGAIGPCIRDHTFKSGTIFDVDSLRKLRCDSHRFDLLAADIPAECRSCPSRTTCQGGCPRDKLLLKGTRQGRSISCDIHKEIIPRLRHLAQTS